MQVHPKQKDRELAREVYNLFRDKPGAQHIASEFALAHLSSVIDAEKPRRVLEMGAGIGTITYLLCHHQSRPENIISTEENDFCLEQLGKNLPRENLNGLEIVTSPSDIADLDKPFDVIIFDSSHDEIDISHLMKEGTVCFIEGSRKPTRNTIQRRLKNAGLRCDFTNHPRGRKFFHVFTRKWNVLGLSIPKVKFFKSIKGCWIGKVERI